MRKTYILKQDLNILIVDSKESISGQEIKEFSKSVKK